MFLPPGWEICYCHISLFKVAVKKLASFSNIICEAFLFAL